MQTTEEAILREYDKNIENQFLYGKNHAKHVQLKVRCQKCGLHFIICTLFENRHDATSLRCPECGVRGSKMVWREEVNGFIHEQVPGNRAVLVELKEAPTTTIEFRAGTRRVAVER